MQQLIPFDQSKGGTIPDLCLSNVCKGYAIGNKYPTAWIAWLNTHGHPDRNIPAGLAVPLFYSYTTTIDGITENYGHINVQLPNGTVWSDGNIYANIDDYTSKKQPKYVGWGESVNDYKILEGDTMATEEFITTAWQAGFNRSPRPDEMAAMQGKTELEVEQHILANNEDFRSKAANYDALAAEFDAYKIANPPGEGVVLKPGGYIVQ